MQLIPVAPPRMLSGTRLQVEHGGAVPGSTVYGMQLGFDADQFWALPSVHIELGLIVAIAVITASPAEPVSTGPQQPTRR